MVIGHTVDTYGNIPAPGILALLKWTGLEFAEVTVNLFNQPKWASWIARGMKLGLHLPNVGNSGFDLASIEQQDRVEEMLATIQRYGPGLPLEYAVFHPPEKDRSEAVLNFLVQNLKRVPLPLIVENIRSITLADFVSLYGDLKERLSGQLEGICFDVAHAVLAGEDWKKWFSRLVEDIRVVHLSDCIPPEDTHMPFGMGGILSLEEIFRLFKSEGYEGVINFEVLPPSAGELGRIFEDHLQAKAYFDRSGLRKFRFRTRILSAWKGWPLLSRG